MRSQPRKERLLETAFRLFNRQGYHATGIDQILAESGVAKATLYKYFPSKDALILAVLEQRHAELEKRLTLSLSQSQGKEKVLAIFDVLDLWFHSESFQGCNFIQASGEYADPQHPIHQAAAAHKRWFKDLLAESLENASLSAPLMLLVDGAIVAAQVRGELNAAKLARQTAQRLLNAE
ncbi:TetR family transcriptional regulator [bacterium (Candidatus Blackallbacteria) CG17_big_fil_post_rev_8_21_14_2_50_48_46]|uniref:TetR family transcriptional regulator n=1 Tax=bacterium (Candidatus Blackallbacteria) CG17_big_fil_post_rev_8_21_14_2_50_48_46 TaxID=2014261 RepID=A0A2M7G588_9BACT|nr:MAG: TetR family transcriptional regulator [bacterium (Candidatus Blackallbacteria) CG18_big_fil_WC_8_21_14_2_50_49_26]PIW17100.1 MAG: TetR family transcriptional regulator [bacterium (Candidatus Blackallbacteria) CG17_big_fil_post_rev_8_21_14_2_50_48_46]PIW50009.1 MAG: TetR family transcriptional regulator [bacterium (Candidatus Blackallbacteria) CG13_big_fil_rev_8_21_14_2_50_49_14]